MRSWEKYPGQKESRTSPCRIGCVGHVSALFDSLFRMSSPKKPPQSLQIKRKLSKDRATLWESKIVQKDTKSKYSTILYYLCLSGTEGNYIYALLSLYLLWLGCSSCFHIYIPWKQKHRTWNQQTISLWPTFNLPHCLGIKAPQGSSSSHRLQVIGPAPMAIAQSSGETLLVTVEETATWRSLFLILCGFYFQPYQDSSRAHLVGCNTCSLFLKSIYFAVFTMRNILVLLWALFCGTFQIGAQHFPLN